jgi:AraC family transcriptional regulator
MRATRGLLAVPMQPAADPRAEDPSGTRTFVFGQSKLILEVKEAARPARRVLYPRGHRISIRLSGSAGPVEHEVGGITTRLTPLQPGEICLIPVGYHSVWRIPAGSASWATLALSPAEFAALGAHETAVLPMLSKQPDEFAYAVIHRLVQATGYPGSMAQELAARLIPALALHLLHAYRVGRTAAADTAAQQLEGLAARIRQHVRDHLGERMTLHDLIAATGATRRRLLTVFQQCFHTTPARYVLETRLNHAAERVVMGSETLTRIALSSGFASPSHFTTAFKRRFGVTPRAWRERG